MTDVSGQSAHVWDPFNGTRSMASILESYGITDWDEIADTISHMSDDARVFMGRRTIVTLPPDAFPARPEHDLDADLIADELDNCLDDYNPGQSDGDGDGIGNACDADYDNDGRVGFSDIVPIIRSWKSRAGDPNFNPAVDCDDNGRIGIVDFSFWRDRLGEAPGPAAGQ